MLAAAVVSSTSFAQSFAAGRKFQFDIPSQSLATALIAYATQAQVQLIVPAETLDGLTTGAIKGELDARTALEMLLGRSNLGFEVTGPRTVTVNRKTAK